MTRFLFVTKQRCAQILEYIYFQDWKNYIFQLFR